MSSEKLTAADLQNELANFTGTENYYRHGVNRAIVYTDGAQHVAQAAGAYWLLDEIALANLCRQLVNDEGQQIWNLRRDGRGAVLSCDGNNGLGGSVRIFTKVIPYTDFPFDEFTLYCFEDATFGKVILLPSEN